MNAMIRNAHVQRVFGLYILGCWSTRPADAPVYPSRWQIPSEVLVKTIGLLTSEEDVGLLVNDFRGDYCRLRTASHPFDI